MLKDITWYIYKPLAWRVRLGCRVTDETCRYSVHEGGRSVGFRQCARRPAETVEGYGFCRQHAKEVREALKR